MSIKSICNTEVATIDTHSNLKEVSSIMQKKHVGSVIVTENYKGKKIPMGIITDRDIALTLSSSPNPQDLLVEQIMRSKPITIKTSEGIYEAVLKMRENGIKRLPVVNDDGSLFGVVSTDELFSLMGEEINNLAKITELQINKEKGIRMPMESPLLL